MTVYLKRMQVISSATQLGYFLLWVISKNLSTVTIFSFPIRLISTLTLTLTLSLSLTPTLTLTLTLTKLRRKFRAANFLAAKIPDTYDNILFSVFTLVKQFFELLRCNYKERASLCYQLII